MKVKLKKGEQLSSNNNYCNLKYDNWVALNQGKSVELDSVPKEAQSQLETQTNSKKGDE